MRGKWATGIPPRNFVWIIKDQLAASERPGGYARTHRKIRRQEEIIWIRGQGFDRVVSLLPSSHNLHAYDELGVVWEHVPLAPLGDSRLRATRPLSERLNTITTSGSIAIRGSRNWQNLARESCLCMRGPSPVSTM